MKRYITPNDIAYFDGNRYHCSKIDCFVENAELREINRIPHPMSYTPILQCSECGATYFGLRTRDTEAEQEIHEYNKQRSRAEEERATQAKHDDEDSITEIQQLEAQQEHVLREEIETHEAQENGDIILPNILTF